MFAPIDVDDFLGEGTVSRPPRDRSSRISKISQVDYSAGASEESETNSETSPGTCRFTNLDETSTKLDLALEKLAEQTELLNNMMRVLEGYRRTLDQQEEKLNSLTAATLGRAESSNVGLGLVQSGVTLAPLGQPKKTN